jgi:2-oxoglutarate dehydrogenase complex dehydrogenase (E1) component-like enzyme
LICSGKIFYEIDNERKTRKKENEFGIIRIEELSPFPFEKLEKEISKYENIKRIKYVQEEPENQGTYLFSKPRIEKIIKKLGFDNLIYCGRESLSSPAVGIQSKHKDEINLLLNDIFK